MAIVPLTKIRIFTLSNDTTPLVALLHDAGCTEIIQEGDAPHAITSIATEDVLRRHAKIEMARQFFARYHTDGFLKTAFEGGRVLTSLQELKRLTFDIVVPIIEAAEAYQEKIATLERTIQVTRDQLTVLDGWENLSVPLSRCIATQKTHTIAITGTEKEVDALILALETEHRETTAVTRVGVRTALITALTPVAPLVYEKVSAYGLEVVTLPASPHTAAAEITELKKTLSDTEQTLLELHEHIRSDAEKNLPILKKLSDTTKWEMDQLVTAQNLPTTNRTSYVTAWVPESALSTLTDSITTQIPHAAIEIVAATDEDLQPTALVNSALVTPFETITQLYGAPHHRDLDPTPPLAFFYFLFFGLCLSDVGYGLVLMALTGFVLKRYYLDQSTKQLMTLLFFGGIGTVLAGILFGGYFGINLVALAQAYPATEILLKLQKFDPINNPLPVFYLSLILGFIHLWFGVFLNFWRKLKLGEIKDAYLDDAPWLFVFTLITLYGLSATGFMFEPIRSTILTNTNTIALLATGLIVATQGHAQKNPIMKFLYGLLGLYGIVGYFADMLSYSRLMALGLATGALAFSINSIAVFLGGDSLGFGTILMLFVLLLGHTLNLVLSLLGTFINSARLQFVEFFSKFATGTGRPFIAFRPEPKHTIVLPDQASSP